jgi:tetratricopeptide (TPR) repeat protein
MAKKSRRQKQRAVTSSPSSTTQFDRYFALIQQQVVHENYVEAIATCQRLLNILPPRSPLRVDALLQLGVSHAMLQNFPESYEAFTEALAINPNDAEVWYNRGMASRFTSRFGRSLRDYQRAGELNTRPEMNRRIEKEIRFAEKMVKNSLRLRGPRFTLDELIEQEDLFQHGLESMQAGRWQEAEEAFRTSIAMGDCLPQPWGNLGLSLMMQERYDEAEEALKRALVIDPQYAIAKSNLALMPEIRRNGPPDIFEITEPFRNAKMKQSITFVKE